MKERNDDRHCSRSVSELIVFRRRPLTRREATLIIAEIRDSETITGYSVSEWTGGRDTFVALDRETGQLVGATLVHHFYGGWSEIAVLYVREPYRGNGLGAAMFRECLASIKDVHPRILIFFYEPVMQRIAERSGFSIYDSALSFAAKSTGRRLFMHVFYQMQWRANVYRLREIRRKRAQYRCTFSFRLGVIDGRGGNGSFTTIEMDDDVRS